MDEASYWQRQAAAAVEECEFTIQAQRNEIQNLQRQVSDLLHERSLMKAATASDFRSFCLNYQATAPQQAHVFPVAPMHPSALSSSGPVIPVYDLLMFLHQYSNGLVPPPENRRKRTRTPNSSGASNSPAAGVPGSPRLLQRMRTRQRWASQEDGVDFPTAAVGGQ